MLFRLPLPTINYFSDFPPQILCILESRIKLVAQYLQCLIILCNFTYLKMDPIHLAYHCIHSCLCYSCKYFVVLVLSVKRCVCQCSMTCLLVFTQYSVVPNTTNNEAKILLLADLNQAALYSFYHLVFIRSRY